MSKLLVPALLVALSLVALTVAERRLDNSKKLIEPRDGHIVEHRPKKLFGKFKRQKSQYGPPKVHHQPKKPKYGPPPVIYGPPHPIVYGPPNQAHPKPIHPAPQGHHGTLPHPHHPPKSIAYNRPAPVYSQPGPPQLSYRPPAYSGPPQIVYNRPNPVYSKPAPHPPTYVPPVATYSQPAQPEHYNPPQVHAIKPEVSYSPPAPSYNPAPVQVTQPVYHQPVQSYVGPEHDDSHEDDRKPSDDLPLTNVYNVPYSGHVKLATAVHVAPASQHYKQAEPKPAVNHATPVYIKQELKGNHHQQPAEELPETAVYETPSSAYGSLYPENNQPPLEDDPPKQTAYNPKRPSYSEDSYDHSSVGPSVSLAGYSSSSTSGEDDMYSPSSESDFPSIFDPSSNFYQKPDDVPDANDDGGFFQLGLFPKTSSFFEQNYKG